MQINQSWPFWVPHQEKGRGNVPLQGQQHSPHVTAHFFPDPNATQGHTRILISSSGQGLAPSCSTLIPFLLQSSCSVRTPGHKWLVWHHGVPGLTAELLLKVSRGAALARALAGRLGSTRWGTWPGALGAPLPGESEGSCHCSEGRRDAGVVGLGSATTWSCPVHPM